MLIRQFHGRHYRNKDGLRQPFPPRHFGGNRSGMTRPDIPTRAIVHGGSAGQEEGGLGARREAGR
jgi:hypothetical protein